VGRVGPVMNAQDAANTVFAYAKLKRLPRAEARAALEGAVVRVSRDMKPQEVSNTVWQGLLHIARQIINLLWTLVH
jgi:hypothetical protein